MDSRKEVQDYYPKNLKGCREAAARGNMKAQFDLGTWHYDGTVVKKDYGEAVKWWTLSAEQGYAPAQANLGNCYYNGYGVAQNYSEAFRWYKMAAEQGISYKQAREQGISLDKPDEKMITLAQSIVGTLCQMGCGVEKNIDEAVYWWKRAADRGDASAARALSGLNVGW